MFVHGIISALANEHVLFFDIQDKNIIHEIMLVYSVAGLPTLPYKTMHTSILVHTE